MSESQINKLVNNADKKVAKLLGRMMSVYRPVTFANLFDISNYIGNKYAAFTISKSFEKSESEKFQKYIVYTDRSNVNEGDIFADAADTYVIISSRPIEEMLAIRAAELVKVERVTWTNVDGLHPIGTVVARNVPAAVVGARSSSGQRIPNVDQAAQSLQYEIRIFASKTQILPTDNIRLSDDTLYTVTQVSVADQFQTLICTKVSE